MPFAAPSALSCLRCHLLGPRRLSCARANGCREVPQLLALGPVLLAGWVAMLVVFVLAMA